MREVIAKRALFSYIEILISIVIVALITYSFIKSFNSKDDMWPIDLCFYIITLIPIITYNFRFLLKPKILLVKEGNELILYPYKTYQINIEINNIISASLEAKLVIINTKERGYELGAVANRKHVISKINELANYYKALYK